MISPLDDWREDAACREAEPRMFEYDPDEYPDKTWDEWTQDISTALTICGACSVLQECKKSAMLGGYDRSVTVRGGLRPLNYTRAERDLTENNVINY